MVSIIYFKNVTPSETPTEKYRHWVAGKPGVTLFLCVCPWELLEKNLSIQLMILALMRHDEHL